MTILYKELSYQIVGALIAVRKSFGLGHKEHIYQNALEEELKKLQLTYIREPSIKVVSPTSGKFMGIYRPDFLVEDKVIVELKVQRVLTINSWTQLYQYLRNTSCELAYLVNFSPVEMSIKRVILTNSRKRLAPNRIE